MGWDDWIEVNCNECGHQFRVPTGTRPPYSRYCQVCALARQPEEEKDEIFRRLRERKPKSSQASS